MGKAAAPPERRAALCLVLWKGLGELKCSPAPCSTSLPCCVLGLLRGTQHPQTREAADSSQRSGYLLFCTLPPRRGQSCPGPLPPGDPLFPTVCPLCCGGEIYSCKFAESFWAQVKVRWAKCPPASFRRSRCQAPLKALRVMPGTWQDTGRQAVPEPRWTPLPPVTAHIPCCNCAAHSRPPLSPTRPVSKV